MKFNLIYTEIIIEDTERFRECFLDKSEIRKTYFDNVLKSISSIEKFIYNNGFDNLSIKQSPFSSSCYFTFSNQEKSITIRISNHLNQTYNPCVSDDILTESGEFIINKVFFKKLIEDLN